MESTHGSGDHWDELKSNYARNLATGVELPGWAAKSFSPKELAVLGAIRDAAYKSPSGACSLTVREIAQLAEVDQGTAIRAITMAIAGGLIERDGGDLFNCHIHYKVG
jgi:DNA-binding MarR family transcriptional regulator